jgi:hypothetical protein
MVRGQVVYDGSSVTGRPGGGQLVPPLVSPLAGRSAAAGP